MAEIAARTEVATEKKHLALAKKNEIAEQNVQIIKEKVGESYSLCHAVVLFTEAVVLNCFEKFRKLSKISMMKSFQ